MQGDYTDPIYQSRVKSLLYRNLEHPCWNDVHCLIRNLTLRSSRNTPSGASLRFQPSRRLTNFSSLKRQEASIMRFKSQIPAEAIWGKMSVISATMSRTGHVQRRLS